MADVFEVKHPDEKFVDAASGGTDVGRTITIKWVEQGDGSYAQQLAVSGASSVSISSITLPSTVYNDKQTVAAAGTAEALAGSQTVISGAHVKALIGNTGLVFVGDSGVSSANGYELDPGESVFVEIDDLAKIYVDSAVNGEGVTYLAT